MSTITFDTLAYAKKLKEKGFTEQQAEGQAEALSAAFRESAGELINREDLLEFRNDVSHRFERIEGRINLVQWMLGFNLALTVAILWLLVRIISST